MLHYIYFSEEKEKVPSLEKKTIFIRIKKTKKVLIEKIFRKRYKRIGYEKKIVIYFLIQFTFFNNVE